MNDATPVPPPFPPPSPHPAPSAPAISPAPIHGLPDLIEALLRQPDRITQACRNAGYASVLGGLVLMIVIGAGVYGLVVGTFSGKAQLWAAPLKVSVGLLLSALICLPSLYIFGCLSGATARLREITGLVSGLLALVTVLLLGFAPIAWVFSQSTESVITMGVVHLGFWVTATIFGLRFLGAGFHRLNGRSSGVLRIWMILYLIVGLQMSTALRPLIGTADTFLPQKKKFFLTHWMDCLDEKESGAHR